MRLSNRNLSEITFADFGVATRLKPPPKFRVIDERHVPATGDNESATYGVTRCEAVAI